MTQTCPFRIRILRLTVNDLGTTQFPRVLFWCRLAADRFGRGDFRYGIAYEGYERVGYDFWLPTPMAAFRMAVYGASLVEGLPIKVATTY